MARIISIVTLIALVLGIGGQALGFFVNFNVLKEMRMKKKLENVKV